MGVGEDLVGQASSLTGINTSGLMGTMGKWLLIILVIVIVGILAGIMVYYVLQGMKLNKKIILFEKVNGRFQNTKKYKGMLSRKDGNYVLMVPKVKRVEPKPHTQTGPNTYWYYVADNGDWVNFGMGDIDKIRAEVTPEILDIELAYAKGSLDYDRKERYEKVSWLKEHWALLVSIGMIVIILVFMFLIVGKIMEGVESLDATAKTNKEVAELLLKILGNADTIKNGGTGLVSAGT